MFDNFFVSTMKPSKLICLIGVVLALSLTACGGGTQTLGSFLSITKIEGDASFSLVAPVSKNPAGFTFSSSDPTVATISGSTVTVGLAGTTTITAAQASSGSWGPTSTTATLTVTPIVCTGLTTRVNGACVASCIAPATRQSGMCKAPVATGSSVVRSGHTFMPVAWIDTWTNANAYCTTTTIDGLTGWRLPNEFELSDLYASRLMNGQGWVLAKTWSFTNNGLSNTYHRTVDLNNGVANEQTNDTGAYVSCVR